MIFISRNWYRTELSKPSPKKPVATGNAADMVSTKTTNVEPKQLIWTEDESEDVLDQFDKYEDESN